MGGPIFCDEKIRGLRKVPNGTAFVDAPEIRGIVEAFDDGPWLAFLALNEGVLSILAGVADAGHQPALSAIHSMATTRTRAPARSPGVQFTTLKSQLTNETER